MSVSIYPSNEMQTLLKRELRHGEKLVWIGKPRATLMALKAVKNIPLGFIALAWSCLMFNGFYSNWYKARFVDKAPWLLLLPGWLVILCFLSPFVVFGLYGIVSPFWFYWKSFRVVYAITNRRALLIDASWRYVVRSFCGEQLKAHYRTQNVEGQGDIVFYQVGQRQEGSRRQVYEDIGFLCLNRIQEVEEILYELYEKTR